MKARIVRRHEVTQTVLDVPVTFHGMARGSTYFHPDASHVESFEFQDGGREYWGELSRDKGPAGYTVTVIIRTRNARTGHGVLVRESAMAGWRTALAAAMRSHVQAFADSDGATIVETEAPATVPTMESAIASTIPGNPVHKVRRDNVEYHAGRDAWQANATKDSNPYTAGGERAARWDLGWQEACDSGVKVVGYIDMTPTWAEMATVIHALIESGDATGRATGLKELHRMAALADERNAMAVKLAAIRAASESCDTEQAAFRHTKGSASHEAINSRDAMRAAVREALA